MLLMAAGPSAPVLLFDPQDAGCPRRAPSTRPRHRSNACVRASTPAPAGALLETSPACRAHASTISRRWRSRCGRRRTRGRGRAGWRATTGCCAAPPWPAPPARALLPVNGDATPLAAGHSTAGRRDTVYVSPARRRRRPAAGARASCSARDARSAARRAAPPSARAARDGRGRQSRTTATDCSRPSSLSLLAPLIATDAPRAAGAGRRRRGRRRRARGDALSSTPRTLAADAHLSGRRRAGAAQPPRSGSGARRPADRKPVGGGTRGARRAVLRDAGRAAAGLRGRPLRRRGRRARQRHARAPAAPPAAPPANASSCCPTPTRSSRSARPSRAPPSASCATPASRCAPSYRDAVTPAVIQEALEHADLLVWEGHARDLTLEERGGIAVERTPPLVVLQGCYTLDRSDPFILFERGTEAIVATSAAIYSASGSAFARALFDCAALRRRRSRHRGAQRAQLSARRDRAEEAARAQRLAEDLSRRARLRAVGRSDRAPAAAGASRRSCRRCSGGSTDARARV